MNLTPDSVSQNPVQDFQDNANLNPPGFGKSAFNGFLESMYTPVVAAQDIANTFSKTPSPPSGAQTTLAMINAEQSMPGASGIGDTVGNLAGFLLNPVNLLLGEAGGVALGAAGKAAETVAPALTGAQTSLKWGGAFAGSMIPNNIADNYNQNSNSISWGGVATNMAENLGIGMALPAIPYAWGLVKGKLDDIKATKAATAQAQTDTQAATDALNKGEITPDEHALYTGYINKADPATLDPLAQKIMESHGTDVDPATGGVNVPFLNPQDIDNLNSVVGDELASNVPDDLKGALSDYITNNSVDKLTSNPNLIDGMQGFVDHIDQKLATRADRTAAADKIVDNHLGKGLTADADLSQKVLYQATKKGEAGDWTVPTNIKTRLDQERAIKIAKIEIKQYEKQLPEASNPDVIKAGIANRQEIISKLENNLSPILNPKDELQQIRERLLPQEGIDPNYKLSNDYQRLMDLKGKWGNAQTLLDRVHLEGQYEKQAAFRNMAENLVKIAQSNTGKLADINKPIEYLKNRIEEKIYKREPSGELPVSEKILPADDGKLLNQQLEDMHNTVEAKNLTADADQAVDKYNAFKKAKDAFSKFMDCMGAK